MTFRFERHILNDVMDWFSGIRLFNEQVDTVDAKAMVNREAMVCWAIQYGRYVEVLGPAFTGVCGTGFAGGGDEI